MCVTISVSSGRPVVVNGSRYAIRMVLDSLRARGQEPIVEIVRTDNGRIWSKRRAA